MVSQENHGKLMKERVCYLVMIGILASWALVLQANFFVLNNKVDQLEKKIRVNEMLDPRVDPEMLDRFLLF